MPLIAELFRYKLYLIWTIYTGMTQKDQGMTEKDPSRMQKMHVYMFCMKKETLYKAK